MNMGLGRVLLKQADHSWSSQTRQYEPAFPSRSLIESSVNCEANRAGSAR